MANKTKAISQALLYLSILSLLTTRRWCSLEEILAALQFKGITVSKLTLQRAMKALRDTEDFGVECDQRARPYGYRLISRPAFADFENLAVKPDLALLLRLVDAHLRDLLPGHILCALEPYIEAACASLASENPLCRQAAAWVRKTAVAPTGVPFLPPKIPSRIFKIVSEALYLNRKLELNYAHAIGAPSLRVVSPLALVRQGVRQYLVCRPESGKGFRHLALHRIRNARMLEIPIEENGDFSASAYLQETAFNYAFTPSGGRLMRLTFELTNAATVENFRETPLSHDQHIEKIDGSDPERWRVEAVVRDSIALDGWLSAWQAEAGISLVKKTFLGEDTDNPLAGMAA